MTRALSLGLGLALLASGPALAQSLTADDLASAGKLGIPREEARRVQAVLGQLLIVNVDGFGYDGPLALEPGFDAMVSRLQIGGVVPHYGSTSYERIRRTNRYLAGLTMEPLLLCADIVRLRGARRTASFGDGYVGGFIGRFSRLPDEQFQTLAALNAFTFRAVGINVALGPTVDASTNDPRTTERARQIIEELQRYGLQVVLKHFPFLPVGANLHHESPDTAVPLAEAERRVDVFRELAGNADVMMTTHLRDTRVDTSIATFSPAWNALLRGKTGFDGLLLSDGLLMLKNYADRRFLSPPPGSPGFPGVDETAGWAARAILAGHDMVIVEGSAAQTERVFNGLLTAACGGTPTAAALRERILSSAARIAAWKKEREATLRSRVDVAPLVISRLIDLLPPDDAKGAALVSFRVDAAGLEKLRPALEAATLPR